MVLSRLLDVLWAFPIYLLAISLSIVLIAQGITIGPIAIESGSLWLPIIIIGIVYMPYVARPIRGQVLALRNSEFVLAAIGLGVPGWRILLRDILPNVTTTLIVFVPLMMALNMLTESALSFLSIGVQPPDASWGTIIQDGQALLYTRPLVALAPGPGDRCLGAWRSMSSATACATRSIRAPRSGWGATDDLRHPAPLRSDAVRHVRHQVIVFLIFFATPGADPAARIAGRNASPEVLEAVRHSFGFDRPLYVQYVLMMEKTLRHRRPDLLRQSRLEGGAGGDGFDPGHALAGLRARRSCGWSSASSSASSPRRPAAAGSTSVLMALGLHRHLHAGLLAGRGDEPDHPEPLARQLAVLLGAAARLQELLRRSQGLVPDPGHSLDHAGHALYRHLRPRAARGQSSSPCRRTTSAPPAPRACRETRILLRHALRTSLIAFVTLFGLDFGALVGGCALADRGGVRAAGHRQAHL